MLPLVPVLLALVVCTAPAAGASVTVVDGDDLNAVIQEAACGDVINVGVGTYGALLIPESLECGGSNHLVITGPATGDMPMIYGKRGSKGISVYAKGVTIQRLEVSTAPQCLLDGRGVFIAETAEDVELRDLHVHDCGYDGVGTICGARNIRLINSIISDNGKRCVDLLGRPFNGDGVDFFGCNNCTIAGNYIHSNLNFEIQVKGGAQDVVVRDNIIHSTFRMGILLGKAGASPGCGPNSDASWESYRVVLQDNLIISECQVSFARGILQVHDVVDLTVLHNTVIRRHTVDYPDLGTSFLHFGSDIGERVVRVLGNVFAEVLPEESRVTSDTALMVAPKDSGATDEWGSVDAAALSAERLAAWTGSSIDNNLWYSASGALDSAPAPDHGIQSVLADPLFRNVSDFRLRPGSPAAGAAMHGGARSDLGAFQLASSYPLTDVAALSDADCPVFPDYGWLLVTLLIVYLLAAVAIGVKVWRGKRDKSIACLAFLLVCLAALTVIAFSFPIPI